MNKKELTKQIKQLALHFGERVSCEWLSTDGLDWIDWINVEINIPFLINVEKGYVRNIQIHPTTVTIEAQLIATYSNFKEWAEKTPLPPPAYPPGEMVYVDQSCKTLLAEEQFAYARDHGLFPVYAYRLMRNTDNL